jgi:hypothetical protein
MKTHSFMMMKPSSENAACDICLSSEDFRHKFS